MFLNDKLNWILRYLDSQMTEISNVMHSHLFWAPGQIKYIYFYFVLRLPKKYFHVQEKYKVTSNPHLQVVETKINRNDKLGINFPWPYKYSWMCQQNFSISTGLPRVYPPPPPYAVYSAIYLGTHVILRRLTFRISGCGRLPI